MGVENVNTLTVVLGVAALTAPALLALVRSGGWSWRCAGLRMLSLICIWAVLAKAYIEFPAPDISIPVLVDVSDSMSVAVSDDLLKTAKSLLGSDSVSVLPFAKKSAPIASTVNSPSYNSLHSQWMKLDAGATNLEDALTTVSTLSQDGPALLITDGNETSGRADEALVYLKSSHISLFPLTPDSVAPAEFIGITQMAAPLVATADKSTEVRISFANFSARVVNGTLTVTQSQKQIHSIPLELAANRENAVTVLTEKAAPGLNEITATFKWTDATGVSRESSQTIMLAGESRERVLLLNGSRDDDRFLSQALKNESYLIESWAAGQPEPSLPLDSFSAIIINNVQASALPYGAASIRQFVERGGGLVMVGGNKSFGLGGYIGTPIEEVLPVRLVPPQTTKKRLNVAVQLILDKSKSMARGSKLEFAQDAAIEVVNHLKDEDLIGIIAFDTSPFEVLPIMELSRARAIAADRVNRLFANEATNLFPAIEEGWRALLKVNAGRKHMIILTDGKVYDAGPIYGQLVRQIRLSGVTVSTVLLGQEGEEDMLRDMADLGGGSYYQTSDPQNLPRIFISDVKVSTGEQTLKEQAQIDVRRGTSPLRSTSLTSYPPIKGYVDTLPRDDSALELVATAAGNASPLLASRSFKLGKVAAFTSDANGRWSNQWIGWPEFSTFWSDLMNSVRPTDKSRTAPKFEVRRYVERGQLFLDATVYSDPPATSFTANLITPSGRSESLVFSRTAQGRFLGRVDRPEAGRYKAKFLADETPLPEVGWNVSGELFGERKDLPPNRSLLERLAAQTGGKVNPSRNDIVGQAKAVPGRYYPIIPLMALALMFFVLEVVVRELGVSFWSQVRRVVFARRRVRTKQ